MAAQGTDDWLARFAELASLDAAARSTLAAASRRVQLPAGAAVFRAGAPCGSFLFVIAGAIRVQMIAESGREMVLYRVEAGETCILTTACLLSRQDYPAEATAETEVEGAVLSADAFRDLLGRSEAFRDFVFRAYAERLAGFLALIEELLFRRVDIRLAHLLLARRDAQDQVGATHQEIAVELGSVREVISRQLKEFERRHWLALGRGVIHLLDTAALDAFAADRRM